MRRERYEFVRPLEEVLYGAEGSYGEILELLARSGLGVQGGVVLTQAFHERFLDATGLSRAILHSSNTPGDVQRRVLVLQREYGRLPMEEELNRMLCDALVEIGSRTVAVVSESVLRYGLRTIPETRDAVRRGWLSTDGLRRQIEAAARGEQIPTWPVLIQRDTHL